MQGSRQQAYDRGITIFSPDGRLYQVEYAREAVKRGTATVGVRAADGVAFAAERPLRSALVEAESVEKLHAVDDHLGIGSAGHVADARRLVEFARRRAQTDRLRYGEPMGVEALTKAVTDQVQEHTQVGGSRPFGAALLVGGLDGERPRLYETDPSGTPTEWRAAAVGGDAEGVRAFLEAEYADEPSLDDAAALAVEALAESGNGLTAEGIGVATVDADGFRDWPTEEREAALDRLGIGEAAS